MRKGRRPFSEALDYHARGRPGKTEVRSTKSTATQHDLSLAYTPGVAEPCREIYRNPDDVYAYTNRGNLVAVVSNGTAVLGLGNLGPLGAKPVMEGKAVLFKRFADIDVFDVEIDARDPADIIRFCEMLAPTVGGINLEDIKAPECFVVEETLRERLDIPVFHDDQHGTAIIAGAGLINAFELTGRTPDQARVVVSGAGAAGIACARFLLALGVRREHILMCDSRGVIYRGRDAKPSRYKEQFAADTDARTLADAMEGADVFLGVSAAGLVAAEMVQSMAERPIIFALANPDPEIPYADARRARPDSIVATGRSDNPNQVNNVLGFPFIFRGALDVRARRITEGMKVAAARALVRLTREPVSDVVLKAYGLDRLLFGDEYIIPKPFDPRVLWYVAPAVAAAAAAEGVARRPLDDEDAYRETLIARFQSSYRLMRNVADRAREQRERVVYPHGADVRIVRAARRVLDEGVCAPIILGNLAAVLAVAEAGAVPLDGITVIDPSAEPAMRETYARAYFELRSRKGVTPEDAERAVHDPDLFAALMVRAGDADAVLGGLTTYYPATLRPALQVLPLEPGRTIVSAVYVVIINGEDFFLSDCAVNIAPTDEQLTEVALAAAHLARDEFDVAPRVAFISYSDFGSAGGEEPALIRRAVRRCWELEPGIPVDGEMHANTALASDLLARRHPFNRLGGPANVLVFPGLTAANAAYQLLHRLGGAEVIGPVLTGLSRSVHVLQRDADVGDIVNLSAIAALDAQRKAVAASG